jgi:hypothetical protein
MINLKDVFASQNSWAGDPAGFRLTRSLTILIAFVFAVVQNSCGPANVNVPIPTAINTITPITHTPMPTKTTLPTSTPSPTPAINGV